MNQVEIVRMDNQGRGIGYIDGKIVFIPDTLVGEIVEVEIVSEKKNYAIGKVYNYIKKSSKRILVKCPYYKECGGCQLLNIRYSDTIYYKLNKIKNILNKNKIEVDNISVIENPIPFNYRNKIELKIEDGKVGYYQNESHTLVNIKNCLIANKAINDFLVDIDMLNIKNGNITIRSNFNNELLIDIKSKDDLLINYEIIKSKHKLVGIIFNKKIVYGDPYFIDKVNNYLFRVSYDAFFQVNREVTSKMFNFIDEYVNKDSIVLDLYSGVGTLGIVASNKAKKVYSIEIIPNAVKDGLVNAKMNKKDNIFFMCGDVAKSISKINDKIDTVIIDPPRKGLDRFTLKFLMDKKFENIIYISCDPMTLVRDLKTLIGIYNIKDFRIMDMFSYTYHVECGCVLKFK